MGDMNIKDCSSSNSTIYETVFNQIMRALEKMESKLEGLPELSASIKGLSDQMDRILSDRMPERLATLETKVTILEESRKEALGGARVWIPVSISGLLSLGTLIYQLVK